MCFFGPKNLNLYIYIFMHASSSSVNASNSPCKHVDETVHASSHLFFVVIDRSQFDSRIAKLEGDCLILLFPITKHGNDSPPFGS